MNDWVINNEPLMRASIFFGILVLMMLLELLIPKRTLKVSKALRWTNNLSLVVLNTLLMRLILPFATVSVAIYAAQHNYGLFNFVGLPTWLEIVFAIIIFDMAIYWQHRLFHVIPVFWQLHRVHHVDQDIDVTTGSRFHPIEIFISLLIKFTLVLLIGPSAFAVILFEILLNATAMFNHANISLSARLDRLLRFILVTPDMHRVHHSRVVSETNSNYGFNLPWWDRLFGSYQEQPSLGHDNMEIGVKGFDQVASTQYLHRILKLPFNK